MKGMNTIIASLSGEKVTEKKCRKRLAMKLNIPIRRISGGRRIRTRILRSDHFCWSFTKRKTRADALSEDVKRQVFEYWQKSGISRPTGNKSDVKRERLGPNIYASHMIHILEKTQTEVYTDFKIENPEINISQRSFENCKPFFVRPVRQKDRQTCCCRYHVEIKAAFKTCMSFRKKYYPKKKLKIMYLQIAHVDNFKLLDEESDESESAMDVKWEKFEYINFNVKGGPQDAAGGILKRQADTSIAVLRGRCLFTDDSDYDYFLLLVKKTLNVLSKSSTDSWGTRLPRGTEVFSGLYYDRQADPLQYKLIEKKTAVVPADSLVYISAELNGTAILTLPESIHLDILKCINERCCREE
ncbi:hypothetical protein AM593_09181, partial [Mytilus galloprovincialis]